MENNKKKDLKKEGKGNNKSIYEGTEEGRKKRRTE